MVDTSAFAERRFLSRYSIESASLLVHKVGAVADADANLVTVSMQGIDATAALFSRPATRTSLGTYETLLSSVETSTPGIYEIRWTYAINGVPQVYGALVEVGESSPAYDALDVGFKVVVESVYSRFADLFDSPYGGPHLQVYFQSRFGRGRMAQLLKIAVGRLNNISQPHQTYGLDGPPVGAQFPFARWGALLEQALYIETVKHLIRSYTEQPDAPGVGLARLDRRDYTNRWREVLADEGADLKDQLDVFKIAHMGLGRASVLVSGGAYGSYEQNRMAGPLAARGLRWSGYA